MINTSSLYISLFRRLCCLVLLIWISSSALQAQDRCGTVAYNKMIYGEDTSPTKVDQFENWISKKITQKKANQQTSQSRETAELVTIPVVFHIIHNNEPLGTGLNIPDAQILSQIEVLNEDFRRLNVDRVNTPANFVDVAADIEVEFVMAKRDPEGLATDAILRVAGTKSSWNMSDNITLKALSYWPSEDYLNIWVTEISGTLLGFAQFPVSDELDGLEEGSFNALTDGVVIDYRAFGSIEKYPDADLKTNFARGRTATHEIGHFLGLRHIWGDTGSSQCTTDYCDDTPVQSTSTSGCPSQPASGGCSTTEKMFQNYMDYTSDQCMNLFTLDQNSRMRTVLDNSPRRGSLTTSLALLDPIVYNIDLGIFSVSSPDVLSCESFATPIIVVKNYGNVNVSSAVIQLSVNDVVQENLTLTLGVLAQLESTTTSFSEISLTQGDNRLEFEIISVNGVTDQGIENNIIEHIIHIPTIIEADISEDFQNGIENMTIINIDGINTWEIINAPDGSSANQALYIHNYTYENEGTEDWLLSPVMDFTTISSARLIFDYAYAQYPGRDDRLKVMYSTDCGQSFQSVFDKSGADLMTTSSTSTSDFTPSSSEDWSSASIDLFDHIGKPAIQVAFVGVNDFGNNIFIDNISLITSSETSVKLRQIETPPIVSGSTTQPLVVTIKNIGAFTIEDLDIVYTVDNNAPTALSLSNLNLLSGLSTQATLGDINSDEGQHQVSVTISNPNGEDDADDSDNTLAIGYTIDLSTDVIPLVESFEEEHSWISASRSSVDWEETIIGESTAMYVNSAENTSVDGIAWLVSPMLDFSSATAASLFFDLSYARFSNGNSETLKVLLSENGGLDNYPVELLKLEGNDLYTYTQTADDWKPEQNNTSHWDSLYINLSEFIGYDNIRIAFQLTNANGNNIYLDNIEFFTNANPAPLDIGTNEVLHFPNPILVNTDPHLSLIFNLKERQTADIRIFDLAGNQVFMQTETYALNQTYDYDLSGLPSGMLILSVIGDTFKYNKRIVIIR